MRRRCLRSETFQRLYLKANTLSFERLTAMLKPFSLFLFITFTATLLGCVNKKDDHIIEQEIFASLFPQMVEAIYKDPDIYLNFKEAVRHAKIESLGDDSPPKRDVRKKIIVAVSDILYPVNADDKESIDQFIKTNKLKIHISESKVTHKLSLPKYSNEHYIFKYFSTRSEDSCVIYTDGMNTFHISVSFSRIQFDENKEYGILSCSYDCRPKCGIGYIIVVRKAPEGWIIDKVFDTWVS